MRLRDADKKALRLVAANMGTNMTGAVRRMAHEWLSKNEPAYKPMTAKVKR